MGGWLATVLQLIIKLQDLISIIARSLTATVLNPKYNHSYDTVIQYNELPSKLLPLENYYCSKWSHIPIFNSQHKHLPFSLGQ